MEALRPNTAGRSWRVHSQSPGLGQVLDESKDTSVITYMSDCTAVRLTRGENVESIERECEAAAQTWHLNKLMVAIMPGVTALANALRGAREVSCPDVVSVLCKPLVTGTRSWPGKCSSPRTWPRTRA